MEIIQYILNNKRKITYSILSVLAFVYAIAMGYGIENKLIEAIGVILVGATSLTGVSWKDYWKNKAIDTIDETFVPVDEPPIPEEDLGEGEA